MQRWLVALLGLALAAAALVALVTARSDRARERSAAARPHGEIDDASRAALERVLREAAKDEEKGR